jgi:hypothetical protein
MVGPREIISDVLAEFATGVRRDTGCDLDPEKCKFYSPNQHAWEDIQQRHRILEASRHIYEGIYINNIGDKLRGYMSSMF